MSRFVCIRNAPLNWDEGMVTRKFSQYGEVEEVTLLPPHPNKPAKSQSVIVEFESEDAAAAAVEDTSKSGEEYTVTFYKPTSGSTYVLVDKMPAESVPPTFSFLTCSNSDCTKQLVATDGQIYCTPDCYFERVDMMGRVNIYEKFMASMGRSGTGMLEDLDKLDKVTVTVNPEGNRSSVFYPSKK